MGVKVSLGGKNIYNSNGVIRAGAGNRLVDLNGNTLQFFDFGFSVDVSPVSGLYVVNSAGGNSVTGVATNGGAGVVGTGTTFGVTGFGDIAGDFSTRGGGDALFAVRAFAPFNNQGGSYQGSSYTRFDYIIDNPRPAPPNNISHKFQGYDNLAVNRALQVVSQNNTDLLSVYNNGSVNTPGNFSVGYATPPNTARLAVATPGVLSTDIGLNVTNTAGTQKILWTNGLGTTYFGAGTTNYIKSDGDFQFSGIAGIVSAGFGRIEHNAYLSYYGATNTRQFSISGTQNTIWDSISGGKQSSGFLMNLSQGNIRLGYQSTTFSGTDALSITNPNTAIGGSNPSSPLTDGFYVYSKDIVAGNAAPEILTENGDKIRIYSIGGWGTPTGTLIRTTYATYTGTAEAIYTQATIQALMDHVQILSERVAALISDLKTGHQLLKA